MKYIDQPNLSRLAQSLTHEGPECDVHTRIEAYSCKQIKRDKKLFKALESAYQEDVSNSPPLPSWMALDREAEMTPFGPIDKQASRKTLYLLITTLNVAYPDHDFTNAQPSHFTREEGSAVLNALSQTLVQPHRAGSNAPRSYSSYPPTSSDFFPSSISSSTSPFDKPMISPLAPPPIVSNTHPTLFRILDEAIGLSDCEVYSYKPANIDADPHSNDFDDDEDDVASIADETSSGDDEPTFEFDNYDIDEVQQPSSRQWRSRNTAIPPPTPRVAIRHAFPDTSYGDFDSFVRLKRRGALLWSSHFFFLNRKLKRILFVTCWARSKGIGRFYSVDDEDEEHAYERKSRSETFRGWDGAVGAGARALGLRGY